MQETRSDHMLRPEERNVLRGSCAVKKVFRRPLKNTNPTDYNLGELVARELLTILENQILPELALHLQLPEPGSLRNGLKGHSPLTHTFYKW